MGIFSTRSRPCLVNQTEDSKKENWSDQGVINKMYKLDGHCRRQRLPPGKTIDRVKADQTTKRNSLKVSELVVPLTQSGSSAALRKRNDSASNSLVHLDKISKRLQKSRSYTVVRPVLSSNNGGRLPGSSGSGTCNRAAFRGAKTRRVVRQKSNTALLSQGTSHSMMLCGLGYNSAESRKDVTERAELASRVEKLLQDEDFVFDKEQTVTTDRTRVTHETTTPSAKKNPESEQFRLSDLIKNTKQPSVIQPAAAPVMSRRAHPW